MNEAWKLALFSLVIWQSPTVACRAASTAAPSPVVIFSNIPSEIAITRSLAGGEVSPPCELFNVRVLPSQASQNSATLTTNGLGNVLLARAQNGKCPPDGYPSWAPEIDLAGAASIQKIALRIQPTDRGSTERRGHILAIGAMGQLGSSELVVRPAPPLPLWSELKWFAGFIIPALIAYFVARWASARAERRKEQNDLIVFRTVEKDKVDALVSDVKTALAGKYQHPGWQILETLRDQDIISKLPNKEKDKLVELCEKDDCAAVVRRMMWLFPLHAEQLKQAATAANYRIKDGW